MNLQKKHSDQILTKRKQPVKRKFLYFDCIFINYVALLTAVSIYCYLIKYQAGQKHLLPFININNELKQVLY